MSGWSDPQKGGRAVGAALYPTLSSLLSTAPQPGMRATASDAPGSDLYASGGKWAGDPGRFANESDANYVAYLAAIAAGSVYPAPSVMIGPTPATAVAMEWGPNGYYVRGVAPAWKWLAQADIKTNIPIMVVPPTMTSGAVATLAKLLDGVTASGDTVSGFGTISRFGLVTLHNRLKDSSYGLSVGLMPGGTWRGGTGRAEMWHTGTAIEFGFSTSTAGLGSYSHLTFLVDEGRGFEKTQLAATYLTADSGIVYVKLEFGSILRRRIAIVGAAALRSIYGGANDTLEPSERVGPRITILSDSFGNPSAMTSDAGGNLSYTQAFSLMVGANDIVNSSISGSMWGSSDWREIVGRITYDITPSNPDMIVFSLGRNDGGKTYAQALPFVEAGLDAAIAQNPGVPIVVWGMMWDDGPEYWTPTVLGTMQAIRDAALARNLRYISTMEISNQKTGQTGTVSTSAAIGAASLVIVGTTPDGNSRAFVSPGDVLLVDSEIVTVVSTGGTSGITCTLSKVTTAAHAAGAVVTVLARSLVTGNGYGGSGTGNAALWFGSDNTHPTDLGNLGYGAFYAREMQRVARELV